MVGSPLAAFTNSTERLIARKSYIDYCVILDIDKDGTDAVKCHSPDHPEYYNTVSIKIRSTKKNSTNPNVLQHVNALILQRYLGNCFGEPYNPRVGDLVAVLFMYNEKPLILGPIASIQQPPVMRAPTSEDAKYDYVNKWCQWLKPKKDKNYDFFDHPQGKMPVCFKRFHGPVTDDDKVGIGRDEMTVWDCQKGDADPTCSDCCNIDSVPRSGEQWHKIYSTQTESEEAYNSRMELHARCGSYFRVESDNTNEASSSSSEYSEEIGHIRLGNALTESDKRFHLNVQGNRYGDNGVGSFDLHTNHEEVQIASESTGVRFAAIRPEDSQVTWAYELMNFPTTSFIRCYKDGVIEINSLDGNSSITVDGTANKVTVDGTVNVELIASSEVTCTTPLTHVTGNMQIDGTCTHGSCSCSGTFATSAGTSGGQTLCGGTGVDEELTLKGTSDVSKGTVNVDADLACTGGCQLPNVCGSDQVDGELTLSGTSDASKGCVTVDADLECTGLLGDNLKTLIEACCTEPTGWLSAGENWTFASADSPTFTFTISGDKSAKYSPGMRIRIDQSGIKYFIITSVSYSSPDTTITVYGGTDYTMTSATIESPCYSMLKAPVGFPLSPTKWSVSLVDSVDRYQNNPVKDTVYNLGSLSVTLPIGVWNVFFQVVSVCAAASGNYTDIYSGLSTSLSSFNNQSLRGRTYLATNSGGAGISIGNITRSTILTLTSKTTYYVLCMTDLENQSIIGFNGATDASTEVHAICAYL
jgi:phage baseplate assembly protein gpV